MANTTWTYTSVHDVKWPELLLLLLYEMSIIHVVFQELWYQLLLLVEKGTWEI